MMQKATRDKAMAKEQMMAQKQAYQDAQRREEAQRNDQMKRQKQMEFEQETKAKFAAQQAEVEKRKLIMEQRDKERIAFLEEQQRQRTQMNE